MTVIRPNDILAQLFPDKDEYSLTDYYLVVDRASRKMRKYRFSDKVSLEVKDVPEIGFTPKYYDAIYDTDFVIMLFFGEEVVLYDVENMLVKWSEEYRPAQDLASPR